MFDAIYKIVLFGDGGCGKTTLTQRYLTNLFVSDSKMTIGVDFEVKALDIDGKKIKLQIWDFGGEERFRFLLPTYVRGTTGGIFMYDITHYSSLAHIDDWLTAIKEKIDVMFPIIAAGGKADLADEREIPSELGISMSKSRDIAAFIECSSKTGENVNITFEALTRLMMEDSGFY